MGSKIYKKPRERKYTDFGNNLKVLRKDKYKFQQDFADALDVTVESVRNWEQGWTLPETGTLFKICDTLDCDLDYLIGRLEKCTTHYRQIVHDYTGLSEKSIEWLHKNNDADDRRSFWPAYISDIIDHEEFTSIMDYVSDYFGAATFEGIFAGMEDMHGALDEINLQAAQLFYISHKMTKILEDASAKHRDDGFERSSK